MKKAPELVVYEPMSQVNKVRSTQEKKKVQGWSTEEVKDQAHRHVEEDTEEEMRTWRDLNQEDMDQCWEKLAKKSEEEVLDKYKVEDSKREAFRGRGSPLEWRRRRRSRKYKIRKWREDSWARIFALFREYNLQRRPSTHEDSTEKEEMRRQQRMKVVKDMMKKVIDIISKCHKLHRWHHEIFNNLTDYTACPLSCVLFLFTSPGTLEKHICVCFVSPDRSCVVGFFFFLSPGHSQ